MSAPLLSTVEGNVTAQAHRKRALSLAVASSLLSKGGTMVLLLLAMPLAYNVLGAGRLGVYGALQSLMWLIGMSDFGVAAGLGRRLTIATSLNDRTEQARVMSTGFFVMITVIGCMGLIGAGVLSFVPVEKLFGQSFGPFADELLFNLWLSGAIFLSIMSVGILLKNREANHEIHILNSFGAVGNVVSALLLIFGIKYFPQVWFLLVAIYGIQLLSFSLNAAISMKQRPWLIPRLSLFDRKLAGSLCVEGLAFFILVGITPILGREFIRWLLGQYYTPEDVAHFTILAQMGFAFFGVIFMVTYPLGPALVDASARHDYPWVRKTNRRLVSLWLVGLVTVPAGMALFGPWLVSVWFRKPIPLSSLQLGAYGLFLMLTIWTHIHCVLLAGLGRIKPAAVIAGAECLVVCGLAWWGVKHYNMEGGLIGGSIGMALTSFFLMPWLFRKSLRTMETSHSSATEAP